MNISPPRQLKLISTMSLPQNQHGVVLIEALIAILIFSFAVLGIVGLQAAMVKNTTDAKYRTEAQYIASQATGALWADLTNIDNYTTTVDISDKLPGGYIKIEKPVNQHVKQTTPATYVEILVVWQLPGEDQHSYRTSATVTGN